MFSFLFCFMYEKSVMNNITYDFTLVSLRSKYFHQRKNWLASSGGRSRKMTINIISDATEVWSVSVIIIFYYFTVTSILNVVKKTKKMSPTDFYRDEGPPVICTFCKIMTYRAVFSCVEAEDIKLKVDFVKSFCST